MTALAVLLAAAARPIASHARKTDRGRRRTASRIGVATSQGFRSSANGATRLDQRRFDRSGTGGDLTQNAAIHGSDDVNDR